MDTIRSKDYANEIKLFTIMKNDAKALNMALDILTEDDMSNDENRITFCVFKSLFFSGKTIDDSALRTALRDACDTSPLFWSVFETKVEHKNDGPDIYWLIKHIRERALIRKHIEDSAEYYRTVNEGYSGISALAGWLNNESLKLSKPVIPEKPKTLRGILENFPYPYAVKGPATGINELDMKMLWGFMEGETTVFAGPSGIGKTFLMLKISLHIAIETGKTVFFLTQKDTAEETAIKLIMIESKRRREDVVKWLQSRQIDDKNKLAESVEKLKKAPLSIIENDGKGWPEIRSRLLNEKDYAAVFIDDIDLIDTTNIELFYLRNQTEEIPFIRNEYHGHCLKEMAVNYRIPVIASVTEHLKHASESDYDPQRQTLNKWRGLFPFTDHFITVYRDEYFNPDSEKKGIAELNLLKNLKGACGNIFLYFDRNTGSFSDLDLKNRL